MLNPKQRYELWEDYRERITELFRDVEDDLHSEFAPYDQSEADKDTQKVRRLFDMLADLSAFVVMHTDELEEEFTSPSMVRKF